MDPDAEVTQPGRGWGSTERLAAGAGLLAVLVLGLSIRIARFHSGDYYEDGASHWWTAAYAFDKGVIVDPFGLNTSGWWLPGYDPLVGALMEISGTTEADLIRSVGLGAWVGATLCLYAIARPAGAPVALFACALFALSPFDVLNSTVTTGVEPAVALLTLGLLLVRNAQAGKPALLGGAAAAFSVAVLIRYEAVVFVGVILLHQWWWTSTPVRSLFAKQARPYLLLPLVVAAAFIALTWGQNFVSQVVTGPTVDYTYAEAQGLVSSSPFTRGLSFWLVWGPIVAAAGALMLIGVALHLGRLESWLVVLFAVLLTVFLYLGLGTASFRYIAPVEPLMWLLAALALRRIGMAAGVVAGRLADAARSPALARTAAAGLIGTLVVASSYGSLVSTMAGADGQIALNGPLDRAALFVASLPQDDALLIVVDSPVAAQATGLPAGRMIGSALLPPARPEAMEFLREHVQYVVAVNISYYPLMKTFPELALGRSNENFSLLYDASGWEQQYTPKTAWVYEVNRDHAVVAIDEDLFLHIPTSPLAGSPAASGLRLFEYMQDLTGAAGGLGSPEVRTPTATYLPYGVVGGPGRASDPPHSWRLNYTLHRVAGNGSLDTSGQAAVVMALYSITGDSVNVTMTAPFVPGSEPFVLAANNSLPLAHFPLFSNSSAPEAGAPPAGESRIWSLRNWMEGPDATVQVDFRGTQALYYGSGAGGTQWLRHEAELDARTLEYGLTLFAPGKPPYGLDEPILLEAPLRQAAGFMGGLPQDGALRLLSGWVDGKFPWVLESSNLSASRFANASDVPVGRAEAVAWLKSNIEYALVADDPDDPLLPLFPELAGGDSTEDFSLVFTATAPEGAPPQPGVWVFRVNRDDGLLPLWQGTYLRFLANQWDPVAASGLQVLGDGVLLAGSARGIAVPDATVNGSHYVAYGASFRFVPGAGGTQLAATWYLTLEGGNLSLDTDPLVINATYAVNGSVLAVNFTAVSVPGSPLVLRALTELDGALFNTTINDTTWTAQSRPSPEVYLYSLRNWLVSPGAVAVQLDYRDPLNLTYRREAAGNVTLAYEAATGVLSFDFEVRVIRSEEVPAP